MNEATRNSAFEFDAVKLIKNTKGYQWEIKVHNFKMDEEDMLKRLENIDKKLKDKYSIKGD